MSLGELIREAIAAEQAARKVYLGFAHKFAERPDVSNFWQTMADDESDHALSFRPRSMPGWPRKPAN
jgi:rubrerythrin